jgi:hypothetical protein
MQRHTPCLQCVSPSPAIFGSSGRKPCYLPYSIRCVTKGHIPWLLYPKVPQRYEVAQPILYCRRLATVVVVVLGSSILPITSYVFVYRNGIDVIGRRVQLTYNVRMFVGHANLASAQGYISTLSGRSCQLVASRKEGMSYPRSRVL